MSDYTQGHSQDFYCTWGGGLSHRGAETKNRRCLGEGPGEWVYFSQAGMRSREAPENFWVILCEIMLFMHFHTEISKLANSVFLGGGLTFSLGAETPRCQYPAGYVPSRYPQRTFFTEYCSAVTWESFSNFGERESAFQKNNENLWIEWSVLILM